MSELNELGSVQFISYSYNLIYCANFHLAGGAEGLAFIKTSNSSFGKANLTVYAAEFKV